MQRKRYIGISKKPFFETNILEEKSREYNETKFFQNNIENKLFI